MSIPGNGESGAFSGQQQQQVDHQHSINFCSAIPIKKRRFPVFQPCSPPREEKPSVLEDLDSKKNIESLSNEANDTASPVKPEVTMSSVIEVKNEGTPMELASADVDVLASKPVEETPGISLGPLGDLENKKVILQKEESSIPMDVVAQIADVKQEIVGEGKMNVELSLGPKEAAVIVPALEHQQNEASICKPDKLDSLLSLALHEEKFVSRDKEDTAMESVSNPVSANRSNWDLNTTMDVWEGSTCSDAFVNIGVFNKTDSRNDEKSLLTTASTALLPLNKGKHVLDGHMSISSSKSFTQQCKMDDSLGLKLSMPCVDTGRLRSSLSDSLNFISVSRNLSLKQVQSRTVKSEPVDDNSKHDCSIGSCSSTNTESSKLTSVKSECANNLSLEMILQSSIKAEKSDDHRSVMSEVVQDHNEEACKSKDGALLSIARVMQHQESCASSSAMPVSSLPQSRSSAQLPTSSQLTTNGDFSNQTEQSFHNMEFQHNEIPIRQDNNQLCKLAISSIVGQEKFELGRIDEHAAELCQNGEAGEENMDISNETLEEDSAGSDAESQQIHAVDTVCGKDDEEYEDGEVREHVPHSAEGDPVVEVKINGNLELVRSDTPNLHPSVPSAGQSTCVSPFKEKDNMEKNLNEIHGDLMKDHVGVSYDPNCEDNSLQESYEVSEVVVDEKRATSVTPNKQNDMSGEHVQECSRNEVPFDFPSDGSHAIGVETGGEATTKVVKENWSGEDDTNLSKGEAYLNNHDASKDSNSAGNKSRIINLSRPSALSAPFKTKYISNRLLTSRSGKERYSDFDGEIQPRGNRDEFYPGGSNKFVKDRVHDQSVRNSRPAFMLGKGRNSGRFGPLRAEWDSDHNFAPESSYGQPEYRGIRRKHPSSTSDVDFERNERNGYIQQDGTSFGGNKRKTMNDDFPTLRRGSFRRLSSGDRNGPTRGFQMLHRIPRNMSPRRSSGDAGSEMLGIHNDENKFMQHLSDEVINPVYGQPQDMYDELDNQHVRGNRNFPTNMQRKGYLRIRSKSPVRSRMRSPGPWPSPRRRSPNGLTQLAQHRSPALYRMGRIRSPDHACFHDDDMVVRRRGSPSYTTRHNNDLRDIDSEREHIHPRSADSNRRDSPGQFFSRNTRRADALESREMGDGHEYLDGPSHSNKFDELRGDGSIEDRRKFIERRGPPRSFRPNYNNDNDNSRFHQNDGPRPYRFCPNTDTEYVERSNAQEREFDGRIKNQSMAVPRRIRNIEEQQEGGNYRPAERVWHDDGFTDERMKRRRF